MNTLQIMLGCDESHGVCWLAAGLWLNLTHRNNIASWESLIPVIADWLADKNIPPVSGSPSILTHATPIQLPDDFSHDEDGLLLVPDAHRKILAMFAQETAN